MFPQIVAKLSERVEKKRKLHGTGNATADCDGWIRLVRYLLPIIPFSQFLIATSNLWNVSTPQDEKAVSD